MKFTYNLNDMIILEAEKWITTCRVCGISASSQCSKCKKVNYCSRAHQEIDWKESHKNACSSDLPIEESSILFPQYEVVTENESYYAEREVDDLKLEKREMKKYEELVKSGKAGSLHSEKEIDKDLKKMTSEEDETFLEFRSRIKKNMEQVLRCDIYFCTCTDISILFFHRHFLCDMFVINISFTDLRIFDLTGTRETDPLCTFHRLISPRQFQIAKNVEERGSLSSR